MKGVGVGRIARVAFSRVGTLSVHEVGAVCGMLPMGRA